MLLLVLMCAMVEDVAMQVPDEGFMFSPDFFEVGHGCSWRHDCHSPLSMNEWFIAGPGPGISRHEWLEAALDYRANVVSGKGRFLLMNSTNGHGWIQLVPQLASALDLKSGDEVFLSVRAKALSVPARLAASVIVVKNHVEQHHILGYLDVPADGELHELSTSLGIPTLEGTEGPLMLRLTLESKMQDAPASLDLRGIIIGSSDSERMHQFGNILRQLDVINMCRCIYSREDLKWTASVFSCYFMFLYDRRFWDPTSGYQVDTFIKEMRARFNGIESVILWPAYPRIGVDDRNQFDFFRDLPGGIEGVRTVCRQFKGHGIRVLIPYLPWDKGTRRETKPDLESIAELAVAVEADGIHLDTLNAAPSGLRQILDERRPGMVLVPELNPPARQLSLCNLSWAQWPVDPSPPGMPHLKWIEPRHIQHFTCRWNTSHEDEIETAFFNGAGFLLWENIFGTHNPITSKDARLWKRAATILRAYSEVFISNLWDPFYPSVQQDVFIHRWPGAPTTLFTLRNLGEPLEHAPLLRWQLPDHVKADTMHIYDLWNGKKVRWDMSEFGWVHVWCDLDKIGCIAVCFGEDPRLNDVLEQQATWATMGLEPDPAPAIPVLRPVQRTATADQADNTGMVRIPGGTQLMQLRHQRRECGCYPDPGIPEEKRVQFLWGCPHDELLEHHYTVELSDFWIDEAQVSNAQFLRFLEATGYTPKHPENFLRHWPDGKMPKSIADLPVVYVDLEDARAYAAWAGKRLPTEAEWQRAAQGDDGRIWPWGNEFDPSKCASPQTGPMPVRSLPEGRGPNGLYHTCGNVWEWTESEYDDGHVRFCIIRGGSWYVPSGSGWYVPGGPQPLTSHTKFLLLWSGLDRCATIGFRCVRDEG